MLAAVRTPFTYLVGLLVTGLAAIAVIGTSLVAPSSPLIDRFVAAWARTILWAGGVRLKVIGTENVDPSASYVVASNHQSTFDIMAHFMALPVPIRFLAKQELFGVPLLGWALKRLHMVPVDRSAGRPIYEEIEQNAAATITDGKSIIVYPEGTRTTTGDLLPFKKGAFFIAVRTGLPILPTTIAGSHEAWLPRAKVIRGGTITVVIGAPIPTGDLTVDDVPELQQTVRSTIEKTLIELQSLPQS
jgi:1-acyl-sn-glycerol-3-phosphate acyltransferase